MKKLLAGAVLGLSFGVAGVAFASPALGIVARLVVGHSTLYKVQDADGVVCYTLEGSSGSVSVSCLK